MGWRVRDPQPDPWRLVGSVVVELRQPAPVIHLAPEPPADPPRSGPPVLEDFRDPRTGVLDWRAHRRAVQVWEADNGQRN